MKYGTVKVENNDAVGAVRAVLGALLESQCITALLVPKELPGKDGFAQTLIKSPDMLADTNPFAPTMAVQSATILSNLTSDPFEGRIGAVLKPCELRASIELKKFLQVNLDNVLTIGVDCHGTYDLRTFSDMNADARQQAENALLDGNTDGAVREACRICEHPVPTGADLAFGLFGADTASEIPIIVGDRFEKELGDALTLTDNEPAGRASAIEQTRKKRGAERANVLDELKGKTGSFDQLLQTLSTCIQCHNCMQACPICYCKECVFETSVFQHRSDQFMKWAERKGAVRMPTDTLMFHLTRMSHMATSCVACGMCDSACPNQLPVAALFTSIGAELQDMFEYLPGRNAEEQPPVAAFKEDELQDEAGTA